MSDAANNGRKSDGTFAKGNKLGGGKKQEFTKELAKHVGWQEIYWAIKQATLPMVDIKRLIKSSQIENESLLTYVALKKAVNGDFKPLQWLFEMALGKPSQQLSMTEDMQPIKIEFSDAKNRTVKAPKKATK